MRAEIEGRTLDFAVVLPRELVRQGNEVWVMGADDALEIREVEILYRGRHQVVIASGVEPGEQVVVTNLAVPVEGTPLRVRDDASGQTAGGTGSDRPGAEGPGKRP